MPTINNNRHSFENFITQVYPDAPVQTADTVPMRRQRSNGSPFRSGSPDALDGIRWLADAENAMRRNVSLEDTSITRRTGYVSPEFTEYLQKRIGVYQFIRDVEPRPNIDTMRRTFSAIRALRLPAAGISRAARMYGANELSRQACQTVRYFREDYRAAQLCAIHERKAVSTFKTGYKVVRWFDGRKIEFHFDPEQPGKTRAQAWTEVVARFREAVNSARAERRLACVDPLASKPTNFHLQKNAMKMLRAYKKPDANVRSVGIEIECFMPKTADMTRFWPVAQYVNVGSDGSINGYPSGYAGVEFRVCAPAYKMVEVVTQLCAILKDVGAKVNASCGLHVHLDQRNKTPEQLGVTFSNFIRAQNLLFDVVPKSRRDNHYCKKHRGTDFTQASHGNRYKAVNAASFRKHGTLEIRLFNGTVNAEKIINWVKTLWAIENGQPVLRCPKTFDIARRYWPLDPSVLAWLKARQEKFKQVTADNTDVMDAEPIEEN